jgi:pentatricopeptide repeat protein
LLEFEFNDKLDYLIKSERYEEAIEIRDYMVKMGFKRKSNNF